MKVLSQPRRPAEGWAGFRDESFLEAVAQTNSAAPFFVNIGTDTKHPYQLIERRTTALYGLFADMPEAPDAEEKYRVYYQRGE